MRIAVIGRGTSAARSQGTGPLQATTSPSACASRARGHGVDSGRGRRCGGGAARDPGGGRQGRCPRARRGAVRQGRRRRDERGRRLGEAARARRARGRRVAGAGVQHAGLGDLRRSRSWPAAADLFYAAEEGRAREVAEQLIRDVGLEPVWVGGPTRSTSSTASRAFGSRWSSSAASAADSPSRCCEKAEPLADGDDRSDEAGAQVWASPLLRLARSRTLSQVTKERLRIVLLRGHSRSRFRSLHRSPQKVLENGPFSSGRGFAGRAAGFGVRHSCEIATDGSGTALPLTAAFPTSGTSQSCTRTRTRRSEPRRSSRRNPLRAESTPRQA